MFFDVRTLHTPKDREYSAEYEDAFHVNTERGLAAIADGVSSAIFSRQWANILTQAAVEMPPELYTEGSLQSWLEDRRQEWLTMVDIPNLPWNQRQKLQQVGGAFSTLLWIELYDESPDSEQLEDETPEDETPEDEETNDTKQFRLRCFAVGDCSLFHVRDGSILQSFPLTDSVSFDADPISICSVNLSRDHCLEFSALDEYCQTGDLLVLCTDAIGKWAMTRIEADDPPDWEAYWKMPPDDWLEEITELRSNRQMRYDDTTLLLLKVGVEPEVVEAIDESKTAFVMMQFTEEGFETAGPDEPTDAAIETAVFMADCEPATDSDDWLSADDVFSVVASADEWNASPDLFVENGRYPDQDDGQQDEFPETEESSEL